MNLSEKRERSPTAVEKYCTLRGKQPRSIDKVSNFILSAKGSEIPKTTWRWAWKQPSVQKRVTTYKMRGFAPEIQETKYEAEAVIILDRKIENEVVERSVVAKKRKSVRFRGQ